MENINTVTHTVILKNGGANDSSPIPGTKSKLVSGDYFSVSLNLGEV